MLCFAVVFWLVGSLASSLIGQGEQVDDETKVSTMGWE